MWPPGIVSYHIDSHLTISISAVFTADELNGTDLHQVDPVTRRVIGHARQRHEGDWLQGCSARSCSLFCLL